MRQIKIVKIWSRVAIPKPSKALDDPRSYRPISFLYILFKILEKLTKIMIYLLTSCNTEERIAQNIYIHNSNRNYKKLTTTTILIRKRIGIGYKNYKKQCPGLESRYRVFTCKLLRFVPQRHMVNLITEIMRNCSFTLTSGTCPQNKLQSLKKWCPHGYWYWHSSLLHAGYISSYHHCEEICETIMHCTKD